MGAASTLFGVASGGWFDEAPGHLEYAFYTFPSAMGISVLDVDWHNSTSAAHWTKHGGVQLTSWTESPFISGITMPPGSYYTVARVRDEAGGIGVAFAVAPTVSAVVGGITLPEAEEVLGYAQASNDANTMLNTVASVAGARGDSATDSGQMDDLLVSSLQSAADAISGGTESLQKLGQVVEQVVDSGNFSSSSSLLQMAGVVETGIQAADEAAWLAQDAGEDLLGSTAAIANKSIYAADQTEDAAGVSSKVVAIASEIGQSTISLAEAGEVLRLGSDAEHNMRVDVAKEQPGVVAGGFDPFNGQVVIPAGVLGLGGRRLQDPGAAGCDVVVQQTTYLQTNIYHWAPPEPFHVPATHDVKTVEIRQCGTPAPHSLDKPLRIQFSAQHGSADLAARCVRFYATAWSDQGVMIEDPSNSLNSEHTCLSNHSTGTYAIIFEPTTTTVTTADTSTSTSTTEITANISTTDNVTANTSTTTSTVTTTFPGPLPPQGIGLGPVAAKSNTVVIVLMILLIAGLIFCAVSIGLCQKYRDRLWPPDKDRNDLENDMESQKRADDNASESEPQETIDMEFPMEGIEEHRPGTAQIHNISRYVINTAPFEREAGGHADLRDTANVVEL